MSKKVERWIVIPDVHIPYHDIKTLKAIEKFMDDVDWWDGWIQLGDFIDFEMLSTFGNKHPEIQSQRVRDDYEMANEFLDIHQKLVRRKNKKAKMVYLQGNHEYRVDRYLRETPKLTGFLEVENNLNLKKRGIDWIPSWGTNKSFKKGKAHFIHGWRTIKYHAFHTAVAYMAPTFYAHSHDIQEIANQSRAGDDVIVGKSMGCVCKLDQSYIKGNPTNWQQGFGVFLFHPDGFFTEHTIRIFKHRFATTIGGVYDGRKL
jgi:hypothetical protein